MAKPIKTIEKELSPEEKLLRRFARALLSAAEELLEDDEPEETTKAQRSKSLLVPQKDEK